MRRPSEIPSKFNRLWSKDFVHENREIEAGWNARNSIVPGDCLPRYQLAGGGVTNLSDLPEAIDQCISNIKQRQAECERLMSQLTEFRNSINDQGEQK